MSTNTNGSAHRCPPDRPHLQEYVTLMPLWTATGLVAPETSTLVWLCVPVAVAVAAFALRAGYRRLPTTLGAAVTFIHVLIVQDAVKIAPLALLAAYFLGCETYARLLEVSDLVEGAAKLTTRKHTGVHQPKRRKRRKTPASRPTHRKNTPIRPKRTRDRGRPDRPVAGKKRKH